MIPVQQDRVGADGNCLSACLASILELPLQMVPDFAAETDGDEEFLRAVNRWLGRKGLNYRQVPLGPVPPVGWHTLEGVSPRGGQHAVVARDGVIRHDPHPQDGTGRGLAKPDRWGLVEPLGRAKARRGKDADKLVCRATDSRKCFACGRRLGSNPYPADTRDDQVVYVGSECYKLIKAAGEAGWKPPLGGPRLWAINSRQRVNELIRKGVL